jgi:hypothetical protein
VEKNGKPEKNGEPEKNVEVEKNKVVKKRAPHFVKNDACLKIPNILKPGLIKTRYF